VFAIVLLLYAIKKEKARLLIPHLSAQIFIILWLLIVAIVVGLLLFFGAYKGIRRLLGHGDFYMSEGCKRGRVVDSYLRPHTHQPPLKRPASSG